MNKKTPAPADKSVVTSPNSLTDPRLIRLPLEENKTSHPVLMCKGSTPSKGAKIEFEIDGILHLGIVADAVESDGEVMVEFASPLKTRLLD